MALIDTLGAGALAAAALTVFGWVPVQASDYDPNTSEPDNDVELVELTGIRDMRFCEMLPMGVEWAQAYNTSASDGCPAEVWEALDTEQLKKEYNASGFVLNGPKYWMMDSQKLSFGAPRIFGGIESRWVGAAPTSDLTEEGGLPYETFTTSKTQWMVYEAGKKVYELVNPEGDRFVLQAHADQFKIEDLDTLGDRFRKLPDGWSWQVRMLKEPLVIDIQPGEFTGVGDEFYQYYTLIADELLPEELR